MRSLLLLFLINLFAAQNVLADALEFIALDVGEGQAVLLKRGDRGILIDTGHAGSARSLLNKVKHYGVSEIDHIILTHLHPDHASGYFRIREAFPNATVFDNGDPAANESSIDMTRWVASTLINDDKRSVIQAGDRILWMDVLISVLWPFRPEGNDLNGNSLVLAIQFEEQTGIVMGDAGHAVEDYLADNHLLPMNIELLVAGHHGSVKTSGPVFLSRLKPKECVISVNQNNIRGYPDSATLKRLGEHCQRVSRTDLDGDIHLIWNDR